METCEMALIKYTLFIFNSLFAISGIGIIVAGAVVLSDVTDFHHFMDNEFLAPPVVLIVIGSIVFIVAFLGCFGAIRESYNLLIAFAVCLFIIFVMELAVGIAGAVYKNEVGVAMRSALKQSMANYSSSQIESAAWDKVHEKLQCCGVESYRDWTGQNFPRSCCHFDPIRDEQMNNECLGQAAGRYLFEEGCYKKLKAKVVDNTKVIMGVGIGIAFVQVVGMILACLLAYTIKKGNEGK